MAFVAQKQRGTFLGRLAPYPKGPKWLKHLLRRCFGVVLRVKYLLRRCLDP